MLTEVLRRAFGDGRFTPSEAAGVLGIKSPYSTLNRLLSAGVLERPAPGVYRFAPLGVSLRVAPYLERLAIEKTRRTRVEDQVELATRRLDAWTQSGYMVLVGPRRFRMNLTSKRGEAPRVQRRQVV